MDETAINNLTEKAIGCAIAVHRALGPGLLESVYEKALCIELVHEGLRFEKQKPLTVTYREQPVGDFRLDMLVLELKSVERNDPLFDAQLLSYMKLGGYPIGLLINFNSRLLKDGIKRMRI